MVTAIAFLPFVKNRNWNSENDIDLPLVAGAAIFGIGWGIGGYCPGPALTALSNITWMPRFAWQWSAAAFLLKRAPARPGP